MSMYHDSDNFEQLRRLLALKRHEQPPPGYFNTFSRQICARIEAGERAADSNLFGWLSNLEWFQGLRASLEAKPIFAGVAGVAACAFLLAGLVYSTERMDSEPQAIIAPPVADLGLASTHVSRASVFEAPALASFQLNNNMGNSASPSSLLPVQPVNFVLPGN
jgi:hypothetical protein